MTGYDRSKFVSIPPTIEEELTCGICLNILNNPMTTPCCRHSYCKQCILLSLQKASNPNTCPNDRNKLLSKDLIPASRVVTNILDKQDVYCDYKSYGCPKTVVLSQLSQHLIQCLFDPNKSSDKCNQLLNSFADSVDKLKNKIKLKDLDQLRKQCADLRIEIKSLASNKTSVKTVLMNPSSDEFKKQVMDSAKNNIENHEIIESNIESSLQKKVIKKSKQAIRQSSDYQQIGQFLIDCLNNDDYEWSAFVYPKNSSVHIMSGFEHKMELTFGDLCIVVVSHYAQDDDDNYTDVDVGDDYFDYSEDLADDDDDEEDFWYARNEVNGI